MFKRLGDQLLEEGLVTADEVHRAARNQVVQGGRLGTNLIELGALALDELAAALGRQRDMPPVLEQHFDNRDTSLAEYLTPELAAELHVIPLYTGLDDSVVVAGTDPLPHESIVELAERFRRPVTLGIAPQLRIVYWLERVYGIDRLNRFKRVARHPSSDFEREETDPERRRYIRTLSEEEDSPAPPSNLARIAVRTIRVPVSQVTELPPDLESLDDVVRAIRQATSRGRVGALTLSAMKAGFGQVFSAGMLLTIRQGVALGWRGFSHRGEEAIEALAVPLELRSVLQTPFTSRQAFIGPLADPSPLDQKIWTLLGSDRPEEVAVLPVELQGELVCFLYAQADAPIPASQVGGLAELAQAVSAAFDRLVKAAER